MKRFLCYWWRAVAMLAVLSCASAPAPTAQLASTQAAIRAAEEAGAATVPASAMHLQMARDEEMAAKRLMAEDEHERASLLLRRAEADAELARALARARTTGLEAQQADEKAEGIGPVR